MGNSKLNKKKKLVFIVINDFVFKVFLNPLIHALVDHFEVHIVGSVEFESLQKCGLANVVVYHNCPVQRKIEFLRDFVSLVRLVKVIFSVRPKVVISMVPKAGLLGMLASFFTRTPVRIHYFVGQVWATESGVFAAILKRLDLFISKLTTNSLVDSQSQLDFLKAHGFFRNGRVSVLGEGSVCGVNIKRFAPSQQIREKMRLKYGYTEENVVTLFMARVTRDKGAFFLAEVFDEILQRYPNANLVIVGPEEEPNLISDMKILLSGHLNRVVFEGFTNVPEDFMNMCDIYCMPSFREGLGMSTLCASATEKPTIGSRIYGTVNAIDDGETGLLFTPNDYNSLLKVLIKLHDSRELRDSMGVKGREMVISRFEESMVVRQFVDFVIGQ